MTGRLIDLVMRLGGAMVCRSTTQVHFSMARSIKGKICWAVVRRPQKQRHTRPCSMKLFQFNLGFCVGLVGVEKPVVFRSGVVKQPVRPSILLVVQEAHAAPQERGSNQGAVQHRVLQRRSVKFIGCRAWLREKLSARRDIRTMSMWKHRFARHCV